MVVALIAALTAAPAQAAIRSPGPAAVHDARGIDPAPCTEHLAANAVYRAEGAAYYTDAHGRPERAQADDLTTSVADRGSCQRAVGHMAHSAEYDGGHLIAATLHGVDRRYDLVPQRAAINRGIYERMEAGAKSCLKKPGGRIEHYRVRVTYPDAETLVPDAFHTNIAVDTDAHPAQAIRLDIPNQTLSKDEYDKLRGALDRGLSAAGCG
ncbi:DNA/RNA non-specific endonuclease [Actinomadura violacea]|uniref:DNA/RNA non-specific endonuclease n=1 Tax=Actinomadura violacea TaxID=2819934 RepID=A0ABS3RXJ9_9ACTN|nr:DNA/RNA non-specific endonuclease [Actinomadura violacea]MBO2461491.1 DNA/RNA non-specific endonuclease [Actinomadura violacea]